MPAGLACSCALCAVISLRSGGLPVQQRPRAMRVLLRPRPAGGLSSQLDSESLLGCSPQSNRSLLLSHPRSPLRDDASMASAALTMRSQQLCLSPRHPHHKLQPRPWYLQDLVAGAWWRSGLAHALTLVNGGVVGWVWVGAPNTGRGGGGAVYMCCVGACLLQLILRAVDSCIVAAAAPATHIALI